MRHNFSLFQLFPLLLYRDNAFCETFFSVHSYQTYVYIAITCICIGFLSFKGNNDGNKTFVKIDLSFSTPKRDFSFFLLFEAFMECKRGFVSKEFGRLSSLRSEILVR